MNELLISVEKLSKKYTSAEDYSLKNITFELKRGEIFGVFGPNGAGKTTLISVLCRILPFNSGKIQYFYNENITDFKNIKKRIGFVPQDLAIYQELTAFQNIEYFGALYHLSKEKIRAESEQLFKLLGLTNVKHKKVKTFSTGMKRRLNLALGIVHKPEILFLDEPTVGVDIQSKNAIIDFLKETNKNGTSIIYTSHQLEEAEKLCHRIAILDYGKLVAINKTQSLLADYKVKDLTELLIKLTGKEFRDNV